MITGLVRDGEAVVSLNVQDHERRSERVEFILDTGFTGSLTVPPSFTLSLSLVHVDRTPAELADGRIVYLDRVELVVDWNGAARRVIALVTAGAPLLGMRLLQGHELHIEVTEGGHLAIEPL